MTAHPSPPPAPAPPPSPGPPPTRYCLACDYALHTTHDGRCPECGQPFNADDPATFRPYSKTEHRAIQRTGNNLLIAVAIVVLLIALVRLTPGIFGGHLTVWPVYALMILAIVVALDLQSLQRRLARAKQLQDDMDFDGLVRHHESGLRSWRPLMLLIRTATARGALEIDFATDIYHIGQLDRARTLVELGLRRARKQSIRTAGLDLRAKINLQEARYDEVRQDLAALARLGHTVTAETYLASVEVNEGQLHAAVQRLQALLAQASNHPDLNTARLHLSNALFLLGRFDEALAALDQPFVDVFGYLDPKTARTLLKTSQGAGRLEMIRRRYAKVMVPARLHAAARVHLERKDFAKAVAAIDEVAATLGDEPAHPWTKHAQMGYRAVCFAAAGETEQAMAALHAMWEVSQKTSSQLLAVGSHEFAGDVAALLGKHKDAAESYEQGLRLCVHAMQKHVLAYHLADSARSAGQTERAAAHYHRVVADGFDTWMHRRAAAALAELAAPATPLADSMEAKT